MRRRKIPIHFPSRGLYCVKASPSAMPRKLRSLSRMQLVQGYLLRVTDMLLKRSPAPIERAPTR